MAATVDSHLSGHPLHVVQRGLFGRRCFFSARDCAAYLGSLAALSRSHGCALHAYVLMRNHVHLLLTPRRSSAVPRLMSAVSAAHAARLDEAGLWNSFEAWPVYPRAYVLACMRYIELNPLRAGLVRHPADYPWSSYRANALGEPDAAVTPHAHYCGLGRTDELRRAAYRGLFEATPAQDALEWRLWPP